jgi:predicted transport protein
LEAEEQKQKYQGCNCESILQPLLENKVNVYELFDSFVSYILATKPQITPNSLALYIAALRSYFAFYDIDVLPSKYRRKVKVPKLYKEDEPTDGYLFDMTCSGFVIAAFKFVTKIEYG